MSRLDDLQDKYDSQKHEVETGRRSLAALEEEATALGEAVTVEQNRIRKLREQSQFGKIDYPAADLARDNAALQAERMRLDGVQLEAGRLRRQVRERSAALRQTGQALVQEQRRIAAPLLHARVDGLLEEIGELLPRLAAALAITGQEPPELFCGPQRSLHAIDKFCSDRAAFREAVHEHYRSSMAAVGVDSDVEH